MEISRMLLQFRAAQLEDGFERLKKEISSLPEEDSRELKVTIHVKLEEISLLKAEIERSEDVTRLGNAELADTLHRLKRDYHNAHRRWQALCPSEERRRIDLAA